MNYAGFTLSSNTTFEAPEYRGYRAFSHRIAQLSDMEHGIQVSGSRGLIEARGFPQPH